MQTPIRNFEESKPIAPSAMTPFNVNCYDVIRDLVLEFTNSGAASTLAAIQTAISRVVVLINGINVVDVKLQELIDLHTFLGSRIQQSTLVNVFSLNMGRLLYQAGILRDEFAWACGKSGETDPSKKISSLVVQIYAGSTITGVTDVNLYSVRKNVEADWTDSYLQFNNNTQSYSSVGQSQVNTLPKNANDLFLACIAYPGASGVISAGETLVNNVNVARNISMATNNALNMLDGFGVITNAYIHNYTDGTANSGLLVRDVTSELSVRTTFTTAPTSSYDIAVLKVHNCPSRIISLNQNDKLMNLSSLPNA